MDMCFTDILNNHNANQGIHQEVLAAKMNCDRSTVSKKLGGKSRILPEHAVAFAMATNRPGSLKAFCWECPVQEYLRQLRGDMDNMAATMLQ